MITSPKDGAGTSYLPFTYLIYDYLILMGVGFRERAAAGGGGEVGGGFCQTI